MKGIKMAKSKLRLTTYGVLYRKGNQWVGPYLGVEFESKQALEDVDEESFVSSRTKKATMVVKFKHVPNKV
jgi:hypothetical protein